MRIYLDHNASSPLRPEAREAMRRHLEGVPSNPSSVHAFGHAGRMAVETARRAVAGLLAASPGEIVFTAGGTEANNLALYGAALRDPGGAGGRIVSTAIEHPSVLGPLADLESRGFAVVRVPPDRSGVVPAAAILAAAAPPTVLVSIMLANNETGALQPVAEVGRALRGRGVMLHCDAAQAAGRVPIDVRALGVDLLSIAAHKFGGPPGVGALYVRTGLALRPHLRGGGQELNRRPGTENVPAIAGCGAAAAAVARGLENEARTAAGLRDRLEEAVLAALPGVRVNAAGAPRAPNTTSLAFDGAAGETLVAALDLEGVAVSAGAACSAGTVRRSHVLDAMGLEDDAAASIRVSLGPGTTASEIEAFVGILVRVVERARAAAPVAAGARA
jgi:cysteine desulfurase